MNNAALNSLSDKLLVTLRTRPVRSYSLQQLAEKHNCGRADIVFAIDLLRQVGYELKSDGRGNFRFVSAPDLMLSAEIKNRLTTSFIGQTVYAYNSVQSTNLIASQMAEAGAPDGAIVVAEAQTRGRGRMARPWYSPEGAGIYLSIVLYPDINPGDAPGLSIMTALSLAETMAGYGSGDVRIKWPNDCQIKGRKVAGILTESSSDMISVQYVIIGVGMNINQSRADFPDDIKRTATSLRAEIKKEVRRVEFLQKFLKLFERDYERFCRAGLKSFRQKIIKYSSLMGKRIKLDMQGKEISGKVVDIDRQGSLVLETKTGRRAFTAGEVTVVKK